MEKNIDGFVHPSINETVTRTGRYSSSNPNAQNMPREGTSPVKRMFVTRYDQIQKEIKWRLNIMKKIVIYLLAF